MRLDLYLVKTGRARSRRQAARLIAANKVLVNGRRADKGSEVGSSDRVELAEYLPEPRIVPNRGAEIEVVFCDEALIVVNKPGLIPCHPLSGDERETVMNAVVARFPEVATAGPAPLEGGLVHRLDNGTSGALIVARSEAAFAELRRALRGGQVERRYEALVEGRLNTPRTVHFLIGHSHHNRARMVALGPQTSPTTIRGRPRPAVTWVRPLVQMGNFTLVEVIPETGVRHQIRLHLAAIGHPIVGDTLYKGPSHPLIGPGRFYLHLRRLRLRSPASGDIEVEAPRPPELARLLTALMPDDLSRGE